MTYQFAFKLYLKINSFDFIQKNIFYSSFNKIKLILYFT